MEEGHHSSSLNWEEQTRQWQAGQTVAMMFRSKVAQLEAKLKDIENRMDSLPKVKDRVRPLIGKFDSQGKSDREIDSGSLPGHQRVVHDPSDLDQHDYRHLANAYADMGVEIDERDTKSPESFLYKVAKEKRDLVEQAFGHQYQRDREESIGQMTPEEILVLEEAGDWDGSENREADAEKVESDEGGEFEPIFEPKNQRGEVQGEPIQTFRGKSADEEGDMNIGVSTEDDAQEGEWDWVEEEVFDKEEVLDKIDPRTFRGGTPPGDRQSGVVSRQKAIRSARNRPVVPNGEEGKASQGIDLVPPSAIHPLVESFQGYLSGATEVSIVERWAENLFNNRSGVAELLGLSSLCKLLLGRIPNGDQDAMAAVGSLLRETENAWGKLNGQANSQAA
jgi:hypothetical protein